MKTKESFENKNDGGVNTQPRQRTILGRTKGRTGKKKKNMGEW